MLCLYNFRQLYRLHRRAAILAFLIPEKCTRTLLAYRMLVASLGGARFRHVGTVAVSNKHSEYRDRYGNDRNCELRNPKDLQVNRRRFGLV